MRSTIIFTLMVMVILSLCINPYAVAYDGEVHERINEEAAIKSNIREILLNHIGIKPDPNKPDILDKLIANKTIKQWIAFGGEAEDFGKREGRHETLPFQIDIQEIVSMRAYNHFHNPLENWIDAGLSNIILNSLWNDEYGRDAVSTIVWGFNQGQQDFEENTTGDWSWGKAKESYYIYLNGMDFGGEFVADREDERNAHFACFRSLKGERGTSMKS